MIINSVDRALDVLILLYDEGREMGITEISEKLDMHKSTIHRTLFTLESKGFVKQNTDTEKYWLGMKLYAIGMLMSNKLSIKQVIKPYTKVLFDEFKEVVSISILDINIKNNPRSIIIHKEQGESQILMVNPPVGSSSDCHSSAVGKCLLAFSDIYCDNCNIKLKKYTDKTIDNIDKFNKKLKEIRANGYALDNEELEIGLTCIGAPILDRDGKAIAAMSLSGPTQRMRSGNFEYKIQRVKETAALISKEFK